MPCRDPTALFGQSLHPSPAAFSTIAVDSSLLRPHMSPHPEFQGDADHIAQWCRQMAYKTAYGKSTLCSPVSHNYLQRKLTLLT